MAALPKMPGEKLKCCWEAFVHTGREQNEQRSQYLNCFLKIYLEERAKMEEDDDLKFSDMKSASNLLSREFLSDVHLCCSRSVDDDDTSGLTSYLLRNRGWMILKVLSYTGVESLTCNRELGELLVSLLRLCCRAPMKEGAKKGTSDDLASYDVCFANLPYRSEGGQPPPAPLLTRRISIPSGTSKIRRGSVASSRLRYTKRRQSIMDTQTDSSSEDFYGSSAKPMPKNLATRRRSTDINVVKSFKTLAGELGFFPHIMQKEKLALQKGRFQIQESVEFDEIAAFDLCVLMVELISYICQGDIESHLLTKSLPSSLLPSLLEILRSLHDKEEDIFNLAAGWSVGDMILLEQHLIRLIVAVCLMVCQSQNGFQSFFSYDAIPMLLEVGRICMESLNTETGSAEKQVTPPYLFLLADILEGVLQLVHNLLRILQTNPSSLKNAIQLVTEFVEGHGFELIHSVLRLVDDKVKTKTNSSQFAGLCALSRSLIGAVEKVVVSLKQIKVEYIHAMKCLKRKHFHCEFQKYLHHHHNILGLPLKTYDSFFTSSDSYGSLDGFMTSNTSTDSDFSGQQMCVVATWSHFLFKVFPTLESKFLCQEILQCVETAGMCCCVLPEVILKSFLEKFETRSSVVRRHVLKVTVWALLHQCGGLANTDSFTEPCDICSEEEEDPDNTVSSKTLTSLTPSSSKEIKVLSKERLPGSNIDTDSALSSDASEGELTKQKWHCLHLFYPLINSKNSSVGSQVTKYMLRLVSQGTVRMKEELFITNFLPSIAQGRRMLHNVDSPEFVTMQNVILHCLSALPILLQSQSAQHLFHNHGCLHHLIQLFEVPSLQSAVMKVFEVLIVLDDGKLLNRIRKLSSAGSYEKVTDQVFQSKSWYDLGQKDNAVTEAESDSYISKSQKKRALSMCSATTEVFLDVLLDITITNWPLPNYMFLHRSSSNESSNSLPVSPRIPLHKLKELNEATLGSFESASTLRAESPPAAATSPLDKLSFMVSLWSSCEKLFTHSPTFQDKFIQHDGASLAYQYLVEVIQVLAETADSSDVPHAAPDNPEQTDSAFTSGVDSTSSDADSSVSTSSSQTTKKEGASAQKLRKQDLQSIHEGEVLQQEMFRLRLTVMESLLLICLGCCRQNVTFGEQKFAPSQLIINVKALLQNYAPKDVAGFKSVCMHLLNCATPRGNIEDMLKTNSYALMHLRDDGVEESDGSNSESDGGFSSHVDTAYQADDESADSDSSQDKWKHSRSHHIGHSKELETLLIYPQMCILVLELLIPVQKDTTYNQVVISLLQKILGMAKENKQNCGALYGQGLVKVLLLGFHDVISSKAFEGDEKQQLLLEMFSMLAQQTFSAKGLKSFLQLFLQENPAVDSLLNTFVNLTESLAPQPTYILCFPVTTGSNRKISSTSDGPSSVSSSPAGGSYYVISHSEAYEVDDSGMRRIKAELPTSGNGKKSAWTSSALQMPIGDQLAWPPIKTGFSFSLWLRLQSGNQTDWRLRRVRKSGRSLVMKEESSDSSDGGDKFQPDGSDRQVLRNSSEKHMTENCLHILSLGSKELLFEFWADPSNGNIIIRVTSSCLDSEIVHESSTTPFLRMGQWEHLCVSYHEMMEDNTIFGTVNLTLNGYQQRTVILEYPTMVISPTSLSVLMGHRLPKSEVVMQNSPGWQLGNVMIFKGCSLTKEAVFHIYTLGPDCTSIGLCDSAVQSPVYKYFITKELLQTDLVYEMLTGSQSVNLQNLRESLVLTYTPSYHGTFNLYKDIESKPLLREAARIQVTQILKVSRPPTTNLLLHQQPEVMSVGTTANIIPQMHKGLNGAIDEIGGIGVFLFLYARIVEKFEDEGYQAKALKVLFSLIQYNQNYAKEFQDINGYALLKKVLSTSRCRFGFQTLQVLLDACISGPTLTYSETTDSYDMISESDAVIQDTQIIIHVFLAWKIWENVDTAIWQQGLEVLEMLIHEDHPNQSFNLRQMQSINLIDRLLLICQERIQEAYPSLPIPICDCIVHLIQSMLDSPPEMNHLVTLCDFLLLVHPAASTYVIHTTDTFYFNTKWAETATDKYIQKVHDFTSSLPVTSTPMKRKDKFLKHRSVLTIPEENKSRSAPTSPNLMKKRNRTFPMFGKMTGDAVSSDDAKKRSTALPETNITKLPHEQRTSDPYLVLSSTDSDPALRLKEDHFRLSSSEDGQTASSESVPNISVVSPQQPVRKSASEDVTLFDALDSYTDKSVKNVKEIPVFGNSDEDGSLSTVSQGSVSHTSSSTSLADGPRSGLAMKTKQRILQNDEYPQMSPLKWHESHFGSLKKDDISTPTDGIPVPNTVVNKAEISWKDSPVSPTKSDDWEMYVDPTTMKSVRVSLQTSQPIEDNVEEMERGLVQVSTGLLNLLRDVVINLPDAMQKQVLGNIIKPEVLIVLAHHGSSEIRAAVVRLLDAIFHCSTNSITSGFLNINGFHLLASQLHQHLASRPLTEACLLILFGQQHGLEEDIDPSLVGKMSQLQQKAVVLLLSLLPKTVHDDMLAHNTLCIIAQMFESIPSLAPVMLENGLLEALCNAIVAIDLLDKGTSIPTNSDDPQQIVFGDLEHIFSMIAIREFSLNGVSYYQMFEDIMVMLGTLERTERENYGEHSVPVLRIRCIQCQILQAVIDTICEKAEKPADNYLTQRRSTYAPPTRASLPPERSFRELLKFPKLPHIRKLTTFEDFSEEEGSSGSFEEMEFGSLLAIPVRNRSLSLDPARRRSSILDLSLLASLQQRALKKKEGKIGSSELLDRTKKVVALAVDLILYADHAGAPVNLRTPHLGMKTEYDESLMYHYQFAKFFLEFLMRAILDGMEKKKQKTYWKSLTWQSKDVLRVQFGRLFVYMMSLDSPIEQRVFALSLLVQEPKAKEMVKMCFTTHISHGQKLAVYTHDLVVNRQRELDQQQIQYGAQLVTVLEQCGFRAISLDEQLHYDQRTNIEEDLDMWMIDEHKGKLAWSKKRATAEQRIFHKQDALASRISASAMEVTQSVVNTQNMERKKFIEHVKMAMANGLQVKKSWQHLIQQLTHERAVWFFPELYPQSWQLDPTEGPFRERKRLQRCHLGIDPKFFLKKHRKKLEAQNHPPPLSYVFDDDQQTSDSAALIYRLHTNERIQHTCRCTSVTTSSETSGEMLVGENCVYFVADEAIHDANYTQVLLGNKDLLSMNWPHADIKEIIKRRYQLRDIALEIFLTNGKTSLLAFDTTKERDQVYSLFDAMNLPNLIKMENLTAIRQLWVDGRMTNFEYLIHLNKLSGRTFNDLMQYPVFPFIISDYGDERLDLEKPESYRNLSKPIAVQYKKKEERFIQNYMWLKQEYEKAKVSGGEEFDFKTEPFHYGSHYSNSGTVLHFLVRLPPFTKMFLIFQDRSFDVPDRTFHSMDTTWKLSSSQSTTDVKELIPEFFSLPNFFINAEGYAFGHRQTGEQVDDVTLPKWCQCDARLFTLVNRQALESAHVTQNLHNWIDLVFGYKQTGKAAVEAVNVFHPSTYFGVNVDAIQDPLKRKAMETMIKTYGQTPKQLFDSPHSPYQFGDNGGAMGLLSQLLLQPESKQGLPDDTIGSRGQGRLSPLPTVKGLKWGNYVGSPDLQDPVPTWQQSHGNAVMSLVALPTGDQFGLGPCSCLLVMYSKERGVTTMNTVNCTWVGKVTWGYPDGILRIKNKPNSPMVNFIHKHGAEQVTCCASVPDCHLLFVGGNSGVISVYNTEYRGAKQCEIGVKGSRQCLYGHSGSVTALVVSKPFSILVSTGEDGTCIIWDLNRLSYVRSITDHKTPIRQVCISDTLGDIASVSHKGIGSCLMIHTVNGHHIATKQTDELINCLTYSTSPEGRSVNVVATGLSNGIVRLWSSWDLMPVKDIAVDSIPKPVCSLTYSHDGQKLFVGLVDGKVVQFETPSPNKTKVNFIPVL
ncbi:lysosomal-trafficking regulator-like isoform X2 [Lineus longissimus]|uniref:lysosomal-trafficking regulator-like isoform X2 n=1 Tax=Lineus longissimus TaxID=88925 RepID=UPI002B4CA0E6